MGKLAAAAAAPARGELLPFSLLAAVIVVATALALYHARGQQYAHRAAQLAAVSELRTGQVERWLRDRLSLAQFVRGSESFAVLHRRWRDAGDIAARDLLMQHGHELNIAGRGVLLVDERGEVSAGELGSQRSTPPPLRAAALRAMTSGAVQSTSLYVIASDPGKEWLDLVVPLASGRPPGGALVLRLSPDDLRSTLLTLPLQSRTAVTLLVKRDGDQLVGFGGRNPRPILTPGLLAARAILGELPFGMSGSGIDLRGTPVLGVVRQVPGTDWFLVAKIDRAEIEADVLQNGLWIVATALFALIGAVTGMLLLRQRGVLRAARTEQALVVRHNEELRRLGVELEAAEDRERCQIARDLHDDLAQVLAAARIRLAGLCGQETEAVRATALAVDSLLVEADLSTRSLAAQLAPPVLYELGLNATLEWQGEEIKRRYGLQVTLRDDGQPKPLSQATRSILYRAVRELLINAAKHAACAAAVVETMRDGERIVVSVSDEGVGFDPQQVGAVPQHGLGLASTRDRLVLIGGTLELRSAPGKGTTGVLSAPLATLASMPARDMP